MKEILKLDNQLCFALYSANRAMTKLYKPLLDPLNLTYPQYLVLLVLLEEDNITVKYLGERLHLDSGTLTPLLKRMEKANLVNRIRSTEDERKVMVSLTSQGSDLESDLSQVPMMLCQSYDVDLEKIIAIRESLKELLNEIGQ